MSLIIAQLAGVVLPGLFRRRRQLYGSVTRPGTAEIQGVRRNPGSSPATHPVVSAPAWDGFREFRVERRVIESADESTCSFYLAPTDNQALLPFSPGQFLTFKLLIDDPKPGKAQSLVRCYSLSDCSRANYYRVSIKRVPAGLFSNYFHDHVHEGDRLQVRAPSGQFYLKGDATLPIVLIAGGIGITPMMSMLNATLENEAGRDIWLFYGVRNNREKIMHSHLVELARKYTNFHLHICFSNPLDTDVAGVDYQHRGRVDISLLRATLQLERYQFYVCGPKPMMESLVPALEAWEVAKNDIFYESFGHATLKKQVKPILIADDEQTRAITVTFSKSGKRLSWNPGAASLLEFAEANNIEVDSACRAGSCGCCQTPLEAGEVEYSQQPDADVKTGHCLLCTSTPKSDLTLAA